MSHCQVKNTVLCYISLNAQCYLATGQVQIKMYLSKGQVKILRCFYPCFNIELSPLFVVRFFLKQGLRLAYVCSIDPEFKQIHHHQGCCTCN